MVSPGNMPWVALLQGVPSLSVTGRHGSSESRETPPQCPTVPPHPDVRHYPSAPRLRAEWHCPTVSPPQVNAAADTCHRWLALERCPDPIVLEWHRPTSLHAPTPACSASQLHTPCQWQGVTLPHGAPRSPTVPHGAPCPISWQRHRVLSPSWRTSMPRKGRPRASLWWWRGSLCRTSCGTRWAGSPQPLPEHIPTRPTHCPASPGLLRW